MNAPYKNAAGKWVKLHRVDSFTETEVPAEAPEAPKAEPKPAPKAKGKK